MTSISAPQLFVLILTVFALVGILCYDMLFNPYGINQRCSEKRFFRLNNGKGLRLVKGDQSADLSIVTGHAQMFGDKIAGCTLGLLLISEFGPKLPTGYGILLKDDGGIYEISVDPRNKDENSRYRMSVLDAPPARLDGHLVAITSGRTRFA